MTGSRNLGIGGIVNDLSAFGVPEIKVANGAVIITVHTVLSACSRLGGMVIHRMLVIITGRFYRI